MDAIEYGKKVSAPKNIEKEGYIFIDWYTTKNFTKKFDFNTVVNSDITLKAVWVKVYTVKFYTAGGNNITSQIVEEGAQKEGEEFH